MLRLKRAPPHTLRERPARPSQSITIPLSADGGLPGSPPCPSGCQQALEQSLRSTSRRQRTLVCMWRFFDYPIGWAAPSPRMLSPALTSMCRLLSARARPPGCVGQHPVGRCRPRPGEMAMQSSEALAKFPVRVDNSWIMEGKVIVAQIGETTLAVQPATSTRAESSAPNIPLEPKGACSCAGMRGEPARCRDAGRRDGADEEEGDTGECTADLAAPAIELGGSSTSSSSSGTRSSAPALHRQRIPPWQKPTHPPPGDFAGKYDPPRRGRSIKRRSSGRRPRRRSKSSQSPVERPAAAMPPPPLAHYCIRFLQVVDDPRFDPRDLIRASGPQVDHSL